MYPCVPALPRSASACNHCGAVATVSARDPLERDGPLQRRVGGAIDDAHAARPDALEDDIARGHRRKWLSVTRELTFARRGVAAPLPGDRACRHLALGHDDAR